MTKSSSRPWIALLILLTISAGLLVSDNSHAECAPRPRSAKKASTEVLKKVTQGHGSDRIRVIVQPKEGWTADLEAALQDAGVTNVRQLQKFSFRIITVSAAAAAALAARDDVAYVSENREVRTLGHVSLTTGADAVREINGTNTGGLDGTGIGIAVLDSGIDTNHRSFLDRSNNVRVVVDRDFTGEGRSDDPYGHGTHVASMAAGNGRISNGQYTGIAPNANIINLRVLNSQGAGSISSLLQALDWVLTNRTTYNIRVVNMSLGTPAVDSYRSDPLCLAVRRLVDAGVVVVAASGNNGKDSAGNKVYGRIHSPGNEPSAITVGAANTFGTNGRNDDGVTSYSSRGPTRSYWVDEENVKHYDNLVKPDLVAPGNKIVHAQAVDNLLVANNPQLDAGVSPVDNRRMMYLNGTSMASPAVAGAAALMLQANPTLTPNLVKMILQYTAQPLSGFNSF
ncbi:MAG TPA: S8 family serine peptidase, partial [Pyrinomonadaceae bacterium]|nr:S8 family serine peptidase [Pyrinomonadaceae bacterium]